MSVETTSYERQGFYSLKQFNDVATLKLGKNFLSNTIDLAIKNSLFDVFDHISDNDEIKVLVIMNCLEQIGCEDYIDFCRQVLNTEFDRKSIQRMCNIFDQLILKIVRLEKPIVYADCDEVIDEPVLGALLAFSAGALVYVGATHLLPQAETEHKKYSLFALGAGVLVALAIILSKA